MNDAFHLLEEGPELMKEAHKNVILPSNTLIITPASIKKHASKKPLKEAIQDEIVLARPPPVQPEEVHPKTTKFWVTSSTVGPTITVEEGQDSSSSSKVGADSNVAIKVVEAAKGKGDDDVDVGEDFEEVQAACWKKEDDKEKRLQREKDKKKRKQKLEERALAKEAENEGPQLEQPIEEEQEVYVPEVEEQMVEVQKAEEQKVNPLASVLKFQ